jgi:hypothetical protein
MQILKIVKDCVRDAATLEAIKMGFGKLLKTYQQEDIQDAEIIDEESSIVAPDTA